MDKKKRFLSQSKVYRDMNCLERKIKLWVQKSSVRKSFCNFEVKYTK